MDGQEVLSLAGMPPLPGFFAKLFIFKSVIASVLMISSRADLALPAVVSPLTAFVGTRENACRYRGQMAAVVDEHSGYQWVLADIPEVRSLLRRPEAE